MNRKNLSAYIKNYWRGIKSFLHSKDLLIFCFFLLVATGLWTMRALEKNYETIITIPVKYINIPNGYIQQHQENMPQNLLVTVNDDGTTLVRYRMLHSFSEVEIDAGKYVNLHHNFQTSDLESTIQKQLNTSTKIVKISPTNIDLSLEKLTKKKVPVVFNGKASLEKQYINCGEYELSPDSIYVFGTKDHLKKITSVNTKYQEINNIKDTFSIELSLENNETVSLSSDKVVFLQKTEKFTEKEINDIPVQPINVPSGIKLILFPTTVNIKFHVGMSRFKDIEAKDLKVVADYKEAYNQRIPLHVNIQHSQNISNINVMPANVEFMKEKIISNP